MGSTAAVVHISSCHHTGFEALGCNNTGKAMDQCKTSEKEDAMVVRAELAPTDDLLHVLSG